VKLAELEIILSEFIVPELVIKSEEVSEVKREEERVPKLLIFPLVADKVKFPDVAEIVELELLVMLFAVKEVEFPVIEFELVILPLVDVKLVEFPDIVPELVKELVEVRVVVEPEIVPELVKVFEEVIEVVEVEVI
jgi:hypothetical protein